jgi:DNA-directed RNA polymerase subunit RPC12/RpoP
MSRYSELDAEQRQLERKFEQTYGRARAAELRALVESDIVCPACSLVQEPGHPGDAVRCALCGHRWTPTC